MSYKIERTEKEIIGLLNDCADIAENPESSMGQFARADAIKDTLEWLTCKDYDYPL